MKLKDNLAKILIPILSILIAFIAGGIIILCLGKNPVEIGRASCREGVYHCV